MFSSKLFLLLALLAFVSCNTITYLDSDVFRFPDDCNQKESIAKRDAESEQVIEIAGGAFLPSMESILDNARIMAKRNAPDS